MSVTKHVPVLLHEVLEGLAIEKGDVVLDGTLGGGGYAEAICSALGEAGTLVGFDQDAEAIVRTQKRIPENLCTVHLFEASFTELDQALRRLGIGAVDGIVFDLGLSSDQLEASGRGFTFQNMDEPLLMTFDSHPGEHTMTARDIVNDWDEPDIANVLYGYGEERFARRIAQRIVEARRVEPIETVGDLVAVVARSVPKRGKTHPATKTFQALRMAVNDEVDSLETGLKQGWKHLGSGGRLCVVSFHSIEDRIVKRFMKARAAEELGSVLTKKPVTPSNEEVKGNPRSRSAKLRIIEKN